MITDSHCHLDYPNLYEKLDDIVKRADENQVKHLLTICTTLKSFELIKIIVSKYKNIYGTFGIHPHESENYSEVDSAYIFKTVKNNVKLIGVGETGLDYYYNHSDKVIQKKSFIEHIKAAAKLNIPIIVHSRNAEEDTYEILKSEMENNKLKVLMHCFTGSKNFAKKLLDIDCFISVSGIITFKNSRELVDTVSYIPVDKLMVETDSPYLAPEPNRGKLNEPSYIKYTVSKLSQIKNLPVQEIMNQTSKNFIKIFNLK